MILTWFIYSASLMSVWLAWPVFVGKSVSINKGKEMVRRNLESLDELEG